MSTERLPITSRWASSAPRAADKLLEQGRITLNGVVPELGNIIDDTSAVGQKRISPTTNPWALCAPRTASGRRTTSRHRPASSPSEGLIFLTSDADIVNKVLRARNHHEKEYHVTVDRPIKGSFIADMAGRGAHSREPSRAGARSSKPVPQLRIVLTQGLNRQIRRMCEHLGYNVVRLKRVRIMHMHLDIARGEWRISPSELKKLHRLVDSSTKTVDDGE